MPKVDIFLFDVERSMFDVGRSSLQRFTMRDEKALRLLDYRDAE